jgi:LDH2 family malate/lactate/ureidoglycolate dehydrogenase
MAAGTPRHIAEDVAEILIQANLTGHDSHGVLRIPAYLKSINEKRLDPAAEPEFSKETANSFVIDGNDGFGQYIARKAVNLAIEKAKKENVCCASFLHTNHIGRLGQYAETAAKAGCIGIVTHGIVGHGWARVTPYGGAKGIFSTNPFAIGIPTGDDSPFVLDVATSVVAEGKVQVARSKNAELPPGCILDKNGNPSVKPADLYDGGFLLPFGNHKGYGLGLFTALMGGLAGGTFAGKAGTMKGEFIMVINVGAFGPPENYQQSVQGVLDLVRGVPPASGFDEVMVPGDFESRNRKKRLVEGIELPETICGQLQEEADKLSVSIGEEIVEAEDRKRYGE